MKKKTVAPSVVSGRVPITLDRERYLTLNFNALAAIEDKTGESALASDFWKKMLTPPPKASHIRLLLWAALIDDDPTITLEQAGKFITPDNFATLFNSIVKAYYAQTDEEKSARPLAEEGDGGDASPV